MGNAAQRAFDAAKHDGYVTKRLAATLRVDDHGAVGPLAALAIGRVAVVVAQAAVSRVAVHHGIHVAAGNSEEQIRLAERRVRLGAAPVRLRDDADAETVRLQQAADDGHAEARVVHVGIARYQHDVAGVPAEHVHFGARRRQKRRHAETVGPIGAIGEERLRRELCNFLSDTHAGHLRRWAAQSMADPPGSAGVPPALPSPNKRPLPKKRARRPRSQGPLRKLRRPLYRVLKSTPARE